MTRSIRSFMACGGFAAVALAAAPVFAQTSAVTYHGLPHTAVGGASLSVDVQQDTLAVSNSSPTGGGGVSVALGDVSAWTARLEATGYQGVAPNLSWTAIADGKNVSESRLRKTTSGLALSATFTGATQSTQSIQVYNDGRLVGAIGNQPSGGTILVPISLCEAFPELFHCYFTSDFDNHYDGACQWRFVFDGKVPVTLPNGTKVTGNEVRFVEEVNPSGHYPYLSFDGMLLKANTYALSLSSERAR